MEEHTVKNKKIVLYYVSPMLDFQKSNASVFRVLNMCRIFDSGIGYDASVIGKSTSDDEYMVGGIKCRNLRHGKGLFSKALFLFTYPFRLLRKIGRLGRPDVIVTYFMYGLPLFLLMRYCRRNNIKLVCDVVEWYEYAFLENKLKIPAIHWTMTRLNRQSDGVIAISRFLEAYYKPFLPTLFVPPVFHGGSLMSENRGDYGLFDSAYLNLIYAGVSGKKDLLNHVIEGLTVLSRGGKRIRLHIIGATKEKVERMYGMHLDSSFVICYGYMTHDQLLPYLLQADFSVILRHEDRRYAKAGFSTKFVESFCCGLPVIANASGDMGCYLKDDYNGYLVDGHGADEFAAVVKRIIDGVASDHYRGEMKQNAVRTFMDNFNANAYTDQIAAYFNSILKCD